MAVLQETIKKFGTKLKDYTLATVNFIIYMFKEHPVMTLTFITLIAVTIAASVAFPPMIAGLALIPKLGPALAGVITANAAAPFVFGVFAAIAVELFGGIVFLISNLFKKRRSGGEPDAVTGTTNPIEAVDSQTSESVDENTAKFENPEQQFQQETGIDTAHASSSPRLIVSADKLISVSNHSIFAQSPETQEKQRAAAADSNDNDATGTMRFSLE